jgi:hypothetical protein
MSRRICVDLYNEIIKIKPECTSSKLKFKRSVIFGLGQTDYQEWDKEFSERVINPSGGLGYGWFRREFEFVWDACQKSVSAVSTLKIRHGGIGYPFNIERDAAVSKQDAGLFLYQKYFNLENYKDCQSDFTKNANTVLKNSNTKETFATEILTFLNYFCSKEPGFYPEGFFTNTAMGCVWGGKQDIWTPVPSFDFTAGYKSGKIVGENSCSEFVNDASYINNALRLSSVSDEGCSACSSEKGYQCRFVTDAGLGNLEDCVPVDGKFCSKDNKKCVAYQWNDVFKFVDSSTKIEYTMQLTEGGLKQI